MGLYPNVIQINKISASYGLSNSKFLSLTHNSEISLHPTSINHGMTPSSFKNNWLTSFTMVKSGKSQRVWAWDTTEIGNSGVGVSSGEIQIMVRD